MSKVFNNGDLYVNVAFVLFAVHIWLTLGVDLAVLFLGCFCLIWGLIATASAATLRGRHE